MTREFSVTERLLRHHELTPDPSILNLSYALGLDGPLDIQAFRWSFVSLLERYADLGSPGCDDVVVLDLGDLANTGDGSTDQVVCLIEANRRTPFDIHARSLVRATLLRLGEERHLLTLSFHHAVADAWSLSLYATHLARAYNSCRLCRPLVEPAALRVATPARSEERMVRDRAALRAALAGVTRRAVDPFDTQRGGLAAPYAISRTVNAEFIRRLQAAAARRRTTSFSLLALSVAGQLSARFALTDLVLGTTVIGRHSSEEMALGGAHYHGALLPVADGGHDLTQVTAAVAGVAGSVLTYAEQLAILLEATGGDADLEPAVFVLADAHPMGNLKLADISVSVVAPRERLMPKAAAAHSPSCGRIALFWRHGHEGASLTVFSEPALIDVGRELQDGVLEGLSAWAGITAQDADPIPWCGSVVRLPAPITEAVSPVSLPRTRLPGAAAGRSDA